MNSYSEERKMLAAITGYALSEACATMGLDGWWVSTMLEITRFANEYEFPVDEDGIIITEQVFADAELFATNMAERMKK